MIRKRVLVVGNKVVFRAPTASMTPARARQVANDIHEAANEIEGKKGRWAWEELVSMYRLITRVRGGRSRG